jgi:two-component system nitrogen regulation sensor histidine kinase GlnL
MPDPDAFVPYARLATGVAVLDAQLHVVWLNDALCEVLGVGVRPLHGQAFSTLVGEDSFPRQAARVLAGEPPVRMREIPLHTLRDEVHAADISLQVLEPGRLLVEIHVLVDPGPRETPLSATLRGFAHEVKNPLAGLRGAAQLLQRRVADADLENLATMIIHEADRLATLADRLLRHGSRARVEAVDLHDVLDRITAVLQGEANAPQFTFDYDPSLPPCTGDADRLQQLLLNLARNALEAGARHLTLRTRVEHSLRLGERMVRTALRVDVIDDGPGVPDALLESLFQPLVSGRADGTGLGLALARETAHEHGGELRHVPQPDVTQFSLYLPVGGKPS